MTRLGNRKVTPLLNNIFFKNGMNFIAQVWVPPHILYLFYYIDNRTAVTTLFIVQHEKMRAVIYACDNTQFNFNFIPIFHSYKLFM